MRGTEENRLDAKNIHKNDDLFINKVEKMSEDVKLFDYLARRELPGRCKALKARQLLITD